MKPPKLLLFILIALQCRFSFGQTSPFPVQTWVEQLKAAKDPDQKNLQAIKILLYRADTATGFATLAALKKAGPADNHYFNARMLTITAGYALRHPLPSGLRPMQYLFPQALNEAYRTADESFIAAISWEYGVEMESIQEIELAATYLLNAAESDENLISPLRNELGAYRLQTLGEILFHAKLYEKSIEYTRRLVSETTPQSDDYTVLKGWNTLGQAYQKLGRFDSALACYQRSATMAGKMNSEIWKGINAGFTGQVYFLQKQFSKARPLLTYSYTTSKDLDANIAGYSLQWLGRLDLENGDVEPAIVKLKESVAILEHSSGYPIQTREYREATYYAMADAFRLKGNSDSFYRYFNTYLALHDSLQRITARSSADLAAMRFENGKNFYAVQLLQQQKKAEEWNRNFIIAAILLLSVIALLVLFKQKQQSDYRRRLALQQKEAAEVEAGAAQRQLQFFTQHMVEKTELIEHLQQQLQLQQATAAQQQVLETLSSQTILTEDDWLQFRQLFEKVHTGFFARLKEKTPDITAAEQRMAALTRLQLTNTQIAAMLGISADSVRKTRQRLRSRLGLPVDINLEEVLAAI